MLKFVIAMAAASYATLGAAATQLNDPDQWEYVGTAGDYYWYVEKQSVNTGSIEFPEVSTWAQAVNEHTRKSRLFEISINCRTRTYRYDQMVSEKGGKVYRDQMEWSPMERPLPGSLMEDLIGVTCV